MFTGGMCMNEILNHYIDHMKEEIIHSTCELINIPSVLNENDGSHTPFGADTVKALEYMLDELEHHLPEKWMKELTKHIRELAKILGGYLKAQVILILISFVICLIGLYILYFAGLNVKFPLIIAIGILFVDALPILGSGTVMIPWGILLALNGDIRLAISIIILWIIMSVVRQFLEPKIVSRKYWNSPYFYNSCNVYRI